MDESSQGGGFAAALGAVAGATPPQARDDGLWVVAPNLDVEAMAKSMRAGGFRLSTMTGTPRPDGETTIIYHYARPGQEVNFETSTRHGKLPSVSAITRQANWIEREIHDFFGVVFAGHPNLAPLLRPAQLEEGFFRAPQLTVDRPGTV